MSTRITQAEFDRAAAAWASFLDQADHRQLQELFAPEAKLSRYQANVTFDVAGTMTELLSTPGIAGVQGRFVLLPASSGSRVPDKPRFRVVLYAVDGLGGRISAYFQGDAAWYQKPKAGYGAPQGDQTTIAGPVPYNLIRGWILAWQDAALNGRGQVGTPSLEPAQFATHYGPLQGYSFELSDLVNPLFTAGTFADKTLQLNLGLKSYFPAYPEALEMARWAVTLVVRLYTGKNITEPVLQNGGDKDGSGEGGGPSYDMVTPIPPGR